MSSKAGVITKKIVCLAMSLLLWSCCAYVIKSEGIVYRGRIIGPIDTSIEIYSGYGDRSIGDTGQTNKSTARHPDSNGYFLVGGPTPQHDDCHTPHHWDYGPLEILILGSKIRTYHDTITVGELRALPELNRDSLKIEFYGAVLGVWQLPDIVVIPK